MSDSSAVEGLALLGFMALFHVIGGAAMGIGARQWRIAWSTKGVRALPFLLLWGAFFGGIPLIFGLATAIPIKYASGGLIPFNTGIPIPAIISFVFLIMILLAISALAAMFVLPAILWSIEKKKQAILLEQALLQEQALLESGSPPG